MRGWLVERCCGATVLGQCGDGEQVAVPIRHPTVGLEDEARAGRPKADLMLTEVERAELRRWARRAKTAQFLAMRARIVLACADGSSNKQVAADLGVSVSAVMPLGSFNKKS